MANWDQPDNLRAMYRAKQLRKLYGISAVQYLAQYQFQSGKCGLCGRGRQSKALHVDHDHVTGKVRGLLCANCNHLVGANSKRADFLRKAVKYIENGGL